MKQTMTDMMMQIMPYMTPIAYVGVAVLAMGILSWLLWVVSGWCTCFLRFTGRLLILIGLFFLASQAVAMFLQMPQELDLGDLARFGFKTQPFWVAGLFFFIPGFVLRIFGAIRPTH
ncbi:MAG: transporter [Rhodomicrobium sp.]